MLPILRLWFRCDSRFEWLKLRSMCNVSATSISTEEDIRLRLCKLQRRTKRLAVLLSRLHWKPCTEIHAFGTAYSLPVIAADMRFPIGPVKNDELQYLGGFFDGDGCVRGFSMCVGQTAERSEVLFRFLQAFGGSIRVHSPGRGMRRPAVAWHLSGHSARRACKILSRFAYAKVNQLSRAASWPDTQTERSARQRAIKHMKRCPPQLHPHFKLTWSYVAGFFDAEGSITVEPHCKSLKIHVAQKYADVLEVLCSFLQEELSHRTAANLRSSSNVYFLYVLSKAAPTFLSRMLDAGLLVKRDTALLALDSKFVDHSTLRQQLFRLSGNQNRYRWLDADGCARVQEIQRLRQREMRAAKSGCEDQSRKLQHSLLEAKQMHALKTEAMRMQRYRVDIRNLLREGARI